MTKTKRIILQEPEGGFIIDDKFASELRKMVKDPNDMGQIVGETIKLFLQTYQVKTNIVT